MDAWGVLVLALRALHGEAPAGTEAGVPGGTRIGGCSKCSPPLARRHAAYDRGLFD